MYPDAKLPIVALSANAFAEDKTMSLAAGMNDHAAKPIKFPELFGGLSKYLCRLKENNENARPFCAGIRLCTTASQAERNFSQTGAGVLHDFLR